MKFNLIEKTLTATAQTSAGATTEWFDVTGCDIFAAVMTASAASTPTGATIQLQGTLDKTNVIAIGSTTSVTGNGSFALTADRPPYKWYRVVYVMASGTYTASLKVLAKGDKE